MIIQVPWYFVISRLFNTNIFLGNALNLSYYDFVLLKNESIFVSMNYALWTPRAVKDSGNQFVGEGVGVSGQALRGVRFARYFATCDIGLDSVSYPGQAETNWLHEVPHHEPSS